MILLIHPLKIVLYLAVPEEIFFQKPPLDTEAFLVYINLKKVNHVTHAHYTIVLKRISNTDCHAAFNQSVFQQSPKQTFCAVIKKKLVTD